MDFEIKNGLRKCKANEKLTHSQREIAIETILEVVDTCLKSSSKTSETPIPYPIEYSGSWETRSWQTTVEIAFFTAPCQINGRLGTFTYRYIYFPWFSLPTFSKSQSLMCRFKCNREIFLYNFLEFGPYTSWDCKCFWGIPKHWVENTYWRRFLPIRGNFWDWYFVNSIFLNILAQKGNLKIFASKVSLRLMNI